MRTQLLPCCLLICLPLAAGDFYVAPNGADSNPGTQARPFATLERARKSAGGRKSTVWIRGGVYLRTRALQLGPEDSGSSYRGFANETVRLQSGIPVPARALHPVTDPEILRRLDPGARGKVMEIDVSELGLEHITRYPDNFGGGGGLIQLYFDGKRLPIARWPNRGYTNMAKVLDKGDWSNGPNRHGGTFVYPGERPARWLNAVADGLWLDGFWRVPWTPEKVRVESIDVDKRTITHAVPVTAGIGSKYAGPAGDGKEPWYALNLLEEIDTPGEWCQNFRTRKIYIWPPAAVADGSLVISDRSEPAVRIESASNVRIERLVIEGGLGNGIEITGGEGNVIAGCEFRNLGGTAVIVHGGTRHIVQSCEMHGLGEGGVYLDGGERKDLTPAGHQVINNHMYRLGEVKKTYAPAVNIGYDGKECVGMLVAHNLIHDLPHAAVLYTGNDHTIEFNEVHNVALDSGDVGAFYTWNDWTSRGNVLRYNFVHHSSAANAFYIDDGDSGDLITGNVVYRTAYGAFIGGGHDNIVRGNIVIEAKRGLHLDARGVSRKYDTTDLHKMNLLNNVDYRNPPWSTRYPDLMNILEHPELPTGNILEDNAIVDCPEPLHLEKPGADGVDKLRFNKVGNNVTMTLGEAGFADPAHLDFRLKPDSPLLRKLPRLKEISFEKIGLYVDEYRRALPSADETGRYFDHRQTASFDSDTDRKASDRK